MTVRRRDMNEDLKFRGRIVKNPGWIDRSIHRPPRLTFNFFICLANAKTSLVPRTFISTAFFKGSSNRMVAAEWYTNSTSFTSVSLSSTEMPRSKRVASPGIGTHFSKISSPFSCRTDSKSCNKFIKSIRLGIFFLEEWAFVCNSYTTKNFMSNLMKFPTFNLQNKTKIAVYVRFRNLTWKKWKLT